MIKAISSEPGEVRATEVRYVIYVYGLTFLAGKIQKFHNIALLTPIFKVYESNRIKKYIGIMSVWTCFSQLHIEKLLYKQIYSIMLKQKKYSNTNIDFADTIY